MSNTEDIMTDKANDKTRVPALVRAMTILEIIERKHCCSISEILKESGFPRSSVYVLMDEMTRLGLVHQNSDGNYQLWMRVIQLGRSASDGLDLRDIVEKHLSALLESIECIAVHYGIMDGDHAFYALKKESPRAGFHILSREGMEISLVHAGLGKCLLAFQDSNRQDQIINTLDYTPKTPTSIPSPALLKIELAKIRVQGWAFDDSEGESEIRCVACPVFDQAGILRGAISIVGARSKFTDEFIKRVVQCAKDCAKDIGNELI